MRKTLLALSLCCTFLLSGCGTITGLPSHGGGKRFAIEQELVAASARAAAKNMNLEPLQGKNVSLYIVAMGDEGAGNLLGGRYSIEALLRGDFINTPSTVTSNEYPVVSTNTTTTSGTSTTTTVAENALNAPSRSSTTSDGSTSAYGAGVRYQGLGNFNNETLLRNPRDASYLSDILQLTFFLKGVNVVPPEQAEVTVYALVDVFGTIRSRNDWHLFNQEKLLAKTSVEIVAVDAKTRKLLMQPRTSVYEAEYIEQYALWAGPFQKIKAVHAGEKPLVDFSDMRSNHTNLVKTGMESPLILTTPSVQKPQQRIQEQEVTPVDQATIQERRRNEP